jgi:hypothetical protein
MRFKKAVTSALRTSSHHTLRRESRKSKMRQRNFTPLTQKKGN